MLYLLASNCGLEHEVCYIFICRTAVESHSAEGRDLGEP